LRQAIVLLELPDHAVDTDFDVLWRLAKYRYYDAVREPDARWRAKLVKGSIRAGRCAQRLNPGRPETHFWLAVGYGEYADTKGAPKALKLLPSIRREYEAALRLDPTYENGAAYEGLGDLHVRVPPRLGGDPEQGVKELERGLVAA
jgi:TRAP transporter TatT component family protein